MMLQNNSIHDALQIFTPIEYNGTVLTWISYVPGEAIHVTVPRVLGGSISLCSIKEFSAINP